MNPYRKPWTQMMALGLAAFARNVIVSAAIVFMALAGADNAHAAGCLLNPQSQPIQFGQASNHASAQIGETIATAIQTYTFSSCTPATSRKMLFTTGTWGTLGAAPLPQDVWVTTATPGIAGIGVRVTNIANGMVLTGNASKPCGAVANISQLLAIANQCTFAPDQTGTAFSVTLKFELVKLTNTPLSGSLSGGYIIGLTAVNSTNSADANGFMAQTFGGPTFVASTCTVTTPKISVTLPTLNVSNLSPVGATGGDTNFQIDLQCNGTAFKNVYINLTDATTPSNTTSLLTLANATGSASGVSLQILRKGIANPITFGPDLAVLNNPGQWTVGPLASSAATNFNIPLTVQYVSTGPVTPGAVNAVATFTLFYQ